MNVNFFYEKSGHPVYIYNSYLPDAESSSLTQTYSALFEVDGFSFFAAFITALEEDDLLSKTTFGAMYSMDSVPKKIKLLYTEKNIN